ILTAFTSLAVLLTAVTKSQSPVKGKAHVSRQSPNPRGRKRTPQGPRGVQARDRREVRHAILHHELRREGCSSVSLRGVGTDRAEVGGPLHLQSYEEEVFGPGELLGTADRNGRPRPAIDAAVAARVGTDQGRGRGDGQSDPPDSAQPGAVPQ